MAGLCYFAPRLWQVAIIWNSAYYASYCANQTDRDQERESNMAFFQTAFRFYHEDANREFKQPDFVLSANEEQAQTVLNKRSAAGDDSSATSILLNVFKS
jgi:hypothetical protein